MKSGTESKLKFKQLQRRLDLPLYAARGLLDTLWNFTANNCPHGDIGRFSDEEIAIGIDWRLDAAELVSTLVAVRWLDKTETLLIHDWAEHCEHTVHLALARKVEVFACGTIPSLSRLPKDERAEVVAKYEVKYGCDAVVAGIVRGIAAKRLEAFSSVPSNAPAITTAITTALPLPSQASAKPSLEICAATDSPSAALPVVGDRSVLEFPCDGKPSTWTLTESQLAQWRALYPSLDVDAECRKALAWVLSDSSNRKTTRGMPRFLVGWLSRTQNRGGPGTRKSANRVGAGQTHDPHAAEKDPNYGKF